VASPDPGLVRTQSWMQRAILDVEDGAADWADEVGRLIVPSRSLTPVERLEIYRGMYPLRMVDALQSDYAALAHFLGDDTFAALVRAYVTAHPSSTYTLNRLGDHLPEFIASRPGIRRRAFATDLARLERAIAQAFDEEESPVLDTEGLATVGERAAEARLRPIAALRLLDFKYPVNAYLQSVRDEDHDHPSTTAKRTWVAIFRRAYVVRRRDLTREQHALLAALVGGSTLGDAVSATLRAARRKIQPDEFFAWFREWVAAGMFQSIDL
jgi:hypothetical protein